MARTHDRAIIISSGDEVVIGQLLDTNSKWIAEQLMSIGVLPIEHVTVPDELPVLVETLRRAAGRAPLVIMSGGLGPTDGDLTRAALSEVLGEELVLDEAARRNLLTMLEKRGRELNTRQEQQVYRPKSARCLANLLGTAPGLMATVPLLDAHGLHRAEPTDVYCLPGPPNELRPMFVREVQPNLRPPIGRTIVTQQLHIVGVAEADCAERLGDLTRRDRRPLVGITASSGILTLRLRFDGPGERIDAERLVAADEETARRILGDHIFAQDAGVGHQKLAASVVNELKSRARKLVTVESCTGGMLGEMVTSIPGSSAAYLGGFQTYANELKIALGVESRVLEAHGAVSAPVARALADCGLNRVPQASLCVSITGIAGPDGGSPEKPVGTVHIGLAQRSATTIETHTRKFLFTGDREDIRRRASVTALAMLHFVLNDHHANEPRLLWEI